MDHLSRLELEEKNDDSCIQEMFPNDHLMRVEVKVPWYVDFVNYLACKVLPPDLSHYQKKRFMHDVKSYLWDNPLLFKRGADQVIRRCVSKDKVPNIPHQLYSSPYGGHFAATKAAAKVLQSGFYWPTLFRDAYAFVKGCDRCQRVGNISRLHELTLNNIMEVEIFYV